jgi:hypothetical protein
MDPEVGSWQADLARYWKLRIGGQTEVDAWRDVGMSPPNARMALIENEEDDDSGLIPSLAHGVETVAKRVLARSVASNNDAGDIYLGLILE